MKVGRCQFCFIYQSYRLRAREAALSRKKYSVSALRDFAAELPRLRRLFNYGSYKNTRILQQC